MSSDNEMDKSKNKDNPPPPKIDPKLVGGEDRKKPSKEGNKGGSDKKRSKEGQITEIEETTPNMEAILCK